MYTIGLTYFDLNRFRVVTDYKETILNTSLHLCVWKNFRLRSRFQVSKLFTITVFVPVQTWLKEKISEFSLYSTSQLFLCLVRPHESSLGSSWCFIRGAMAAIAFWCGSARFAKQCWVHLQVRVSHAPAGVGFRRWLTGWVTGWGFRGQGAALREKTLTGTQGLAKFKVVTHSLTTAFPLSAHSSLYLIQFQHLASTYILRFLTKR